MNEVSLYNKLHKNNLTAAESLAFAKLFLKSNGEKYKLVQYGGTDHNMTIAGISADPTRAIAERITNGMDAVIERAVDENPEFAKAQSPKELIKDYMGIDIENMTSTNISQLANTDGVTLMLEDAIVKGKKKEQIVSIIDEGIGITPEDMPDTILSLHRNNKKGKPYTHGHYGQGGSASLIYTNGVTFIASRRQGTDTIGFTVVFEEENFKEYKEPLYLMIVERKTGLPIQIDASKIRSPIKHGTKVKMFGYEATGISSSGSKGGPYLLIRRLLPACELPIGIYDRRRWMNINDPDKRTKQKRSSSKVSYGGFKSLAQKSGEMAAKIEQEKILYDSKDFTIPVDGGSIDVRIFALKKSAKEKSSLTSFFAKGSSIVITNNGQNQHEFDGRSKILENYPYLQNQIAVHVNADNLTTKQKSKLFVSTREAARNGEMLERIRKEVAAFVNGDDSLKYYEEEAKRKAIGDDFVENASYKDLFQSLGLYGRGGDGGKKGAGNGKKEKRKMPTPAEPLVLTMNPTYFGFTQYDVEIAQGSPKKYLHIATDASNIFADGLDVKVKSTSGQVKILKVTPLRNGRATVILDCSNAKMNDFGVITTKLNTGEYIFEDACEYEVVAPRARKPKVTTTTGGIPEVKPIAVSYDEEHLVQKEVLLEGSVEDKPSLENTLTRLIFDDDFIALYYSTEGECFNRCLRKLGKAKVKHDAFVAEYVRQLQIIAIQSAKTKNVISTETAEAMAILAYGKVS